MFNFVISKNNNFRYKYKIRFNWNRKENFSHSIISKKKKKVNR